MKSIFLIINGYGRSDEGECSIAGAYPTLAEAAAARAAMIQESLEWEAVRNEHNKRWQAYAKKQWPKGAKTVTFQAETGWWEDFCKLDPRPEAKPYFMGTLGIVEVPVGVSGEYWPKDTDYIDSASWRRRAA